MLSSESAKQILEVVKHIVNIIPKKCLIIFILTFTGCCILFIYKPNLITFLKNNMFEASFNTKQTIANDFNKTIELHMNVAIKKIATITKGEGAFIFEYMIWDEKGTEQNPSLNPKLMFVRGYNFKDNIPEDARYRLLNKGESDPKYSPETNLFLYNGTGKKADRKTIEEYSTAGIAVDNMFINESTLNGITYWGNFDFKAHTIYGSTIINSAGNRQGRYVFIANDIVRERVDNFNLNEDTGLKIMEELQLNTVKALKQGD